jgi:hypothetical protein
MGTKVSIPQCNAGQFRNSKGSCEGCPDGSFMSTPNNDKQCKQCPGGQISSADKTRCVEEPKINIMIKKGHILGKDGKQIPCPVNTYQPVERVDNWSESMYKKYLNLSDDEKVKQGCRPCNESSISKQGSGECDCPPGTQPDGYDNYNRVKCVPVKVEPQVTQPPVPTILKSENCNPGYYVIDKKCMACPAGTYQYKKLPLNNIDGIKACQTCKEEVDQGQEGSSGCFASGVLMACPPGSRPGSKPQTCEECPAGMTSAPSLFFITKSGKVNIIKGSECRNEQIKEGFMIPDNKGGSIGIIIGISIALVIAGFVIYKRRM